MENFDHLRRARRVLVTTRDRDGTAIHRALRMAIDQLGHGRIRVLAVGSLARRLQDCHEIRLAPCGLTGRPTGSDQPAEARPAPKRFGRDWVVRDFLVVPADEPTSWTVQD